MKTPSLRYPKGACLFVVFLLSLLTAHAQEPAAPRFAYAEPALSPDKREIAFSSGGDIWTVPAAGGEAHLLITHAAHESRPLYSPNGRYLAFQSTRSGNGDLYVLELATGALRRLTWGDGADDLSAWSADSRHLYFATGDRDISSMKDVYRVAVTGGTPAAVSETRYTSEFMAAPSPDGSQLAFVGRGFGLLQWWRKGSSHLDRSELWLRNSATGSYRQLTQRNAKQLWPMWHPDGKSLYYVSDSGGTENLWVKPLEGAERKLTQFTNGRVLWPSMAPDGSLLVFERDFRIWSYTPGGTAQPIAITRRGLPAGPLTEHLRLTSGFRDLALSPDGKKVAFVAYGDVFVAAAKDGGDAVRLTTTPAAERGPEWLPNSNRIVYVSERNGRSQLFEYNFITGRERPLLASGGDDTAPALAPDGRQVAFVRNDRELHVLDLTTGKDALLTTALFGRVSFGAPHVISWSPDSKWIAFAAYGGKTFLNIYLIPAAGGTARPASFLANAFGQGIVWIKDGKSLLFTTRQRTENAYVARVDLVPQAPRFRESQFRELFSDEVPTPAPAVPTRKPAPAAPDTLSKNTPAAPRTPAVQVEWEGLRQRLSLLPLGADVNDLVATRDGKTLVVLATVAGQTNLYSYSLDELAKEPAVLKQLTNTSGAKRDLQVSIDGKEVFFLEDGRIQAVALESRAVRPLAVTAELDVDFAATKMVVFEQAWEGQNKGFYDTAFHGADWGAIRGIYAPYAAGAATGDELRRLISLMLGELNASHSGISGPPAGAPAMGQLGLRFDPATYEREGVLKVAEVVPLGPAALSGQVRPGDYLLAVNGTPLTHRTPVDSLLEYQVNKRVLLTVSADAKGKDKREVAVRPITLGAEKSLRYRQWVQQQRDYVTKVSKGRLGYVHMYDMSQGSLDQLYVDMDQENHAREGVVVDLRNNNGGFVNAYALDVFARRGYLQMTVRGLPPAPARLLLGQRSLEAPTILVINQHSLSDAEDFTEGYRTLGLGKVVGEPTSGWIIYTSSLTLLDGSVMRMPATRITDHEGKNMELNPRPVDVFVSQPFGETERDLQLDTAVQELLRQIDKK
ncbi:S41 family peptidase [Flaviaesturariibacter amylovorans]